jgi:hypothetical protein
VPPSGTVPGRALSIFFPLGITLTVYSSGLGALGDKARGRRGKVQGTREAITTRCPVV